MKTWIKFCGTTSIEDAAASVEAGADALGFIFAPSKRRLTVEKAAEISAGLDEETERIGVFVNETADSILAAVSKARLTGVQLHGDEPQALVSALRGRVAVVKTILMNGGISALLDEWLGRREAPDSILLDSGAGSGRTFDWQAVRAALGERQGRFIIAGGLNPDNVGEAIRIFKPWGVDVVSGIEREPGRKDYKKMKDFVAAVREAEKQ